MRNDDGLYISWVCFMWLLDPSYLPYTDSPLVIYAFKRPFANLKALKDSNPMVGVFIDGDGAKFQEEL